MKGKHRFDPKIFRTTGWGLFRLPDEVRRMAKADRQARKTMALIPQKRRFCGGHDPHQSHPATDWQGQAYTCSGWSGVQEHHPKCFQVVGVPDDLPPDLCDCKTLRMLDKAVEES